MGPVVFLCSQGGVSERTEGLRADSGLHRGSISGAEHSSAHTCEEAPCLGRKQHGRVTGKVLRTPGHQLVLVPINQSGKPHYSLSIRQHTQKGLSSVGGGN